MIANIAVQFDGPGLGPGSLWTAGAVGLHTTQPQPSPSSCCQPRPTCPPRVLASGQHVIPFAHRDKNKIVQCIVVILVWGHIIRAL